MPTLKQWFELQDAHGLLRRAWLERGVVYDGRKARVAEFFAQQRRERRLLAYLSADLRCLYGFQKLKTLDLAEVTRLIVVDTRQADRLDRLQDCLRNPGLEIHLYDHHPDAPGDLRGTLESFMTSDEYRARGKGVDQGIIDLYQAVLRRDGRECVVLLSDVAGKGMAASLLTASLEALATGPIEVGHPPEGICSRLSRRLYARTSPEKYATAFVAVLHTDTGRVCWTNAGHNPALLLRSSGEHEVLGATGLPLGLLPDGDYAREERTLGPGDVMVIYTDGVTEAFDPQEREYGEERLQAWLLNHSDVLPPDLIEGVREDVLAFCGTARPRDDMTLMVLAR